MAAPRDLAARDLLPTCCSLRPGFRVPRALYRGYLPSTYFIFVPPKYSSLSSQSTACSFENLTMSSFHWQERHGYKMERSVINGHVVWYGKEQWWDSLESSFQFWIRHSFAKFPQTDILNSLGLGFFIYKRREHCLPSLFIRATVKMRSDRSWKTFHKKSCFVLFSLSICQLVCQSLILVNGDIVLKTVLEVMFELDFEGEIGNTEKEEKLGFISPCF